MRKFDSVVIVGENEMQTQSYTHKYLDMGKQETIKIVKVVEPHKKIQA
jgi:histidyl-tRNA synthetase